MYQTTYERTLQHGGGTFDCESFADVTHGYSTGAIDGTYSIVPKDSEQMYRHTITQLLGDIDDGRYGDNARLGTWIDGEDIHIDPAIVFDSEDDCAMYARNHNQLAYYIIHEQREVRL